MSPNCKPLASKALSILMFDLSLGHHEVGLVFDRCDTPGESFVRPEYGKAQITIDLSQVGSDEELVRIVRHEMIHVLLGDLSILRGAVKEGVQDDSVWLVIDEAARQTNERQVLAVERMLDGMGRTVEQLLERAMEDAG